MISRTVVLGAFVGTSIALVIGVFIGRGVINSKIDEIKNSNPLLSRFF